MLKIRDYVEDDAYALWEIFFNTVRNVNINDYSKEQVIAWAPSDFDFTVWRNRMGKLSPFIAELDGVIVGYTDLQDDGLIDHFFCHYQYQGEGVGRALMNQVFSIGKQKGIPRYYSEVSITAKPFYEHFGFTIIRQQTIDIRGQKLVNYVMEKTIDNESSVI
ncbi:GNAT family N-acetyltransferase [Aliivibrio sifiae]|uniref:Acetyltransferase n=1 Tax=Aliivibrio sifiae TaxID=566293 RepID=A0A2S7XI77_9GAMM|nr:GNAT family N-acetyltransferase [Aliivibrio sifiae]PQJ93427.1 GNAT family N-acetyltransferase [Aliivibrio sifiae]GLR74487.1 acetyltransferase [Aliivibrio sifiae]